MRITNNMISDNASMNINGNKIQLDADNTRMTTQKKIDRPSEDPVIAVRSLRLQTSLAKINQYYEKNIPDAQSWMDVTETALLNIKDIMTDVRTLCVKGATDTLTEDDRKTIYDQLKKLQEQCFAEGNASYADRTVFTGFRTDKNLAFLKEDKNTKYTIEEPLEAVDMVKSRFYTNEVSMPTNQTEIRDLLKNQSATGSVNSKDMEIQESDYYKLSLSYNLDNTSGTSEDNVTGIKFLKQQKDDTKIQYAAIAWDPTDSTNIQTATEPDLKGDTTNDRDFEYQEITPTGGPTDSSGTALISKIYQFDNESDWAAWSRQQQDLDDSGNTQYDDDGNIIYKSAKYVPDDAVVIIKETGDMVFGESVATGLMNDKWSLAVDYTKAGFHQGELRPEYYFDSTLVRNEKGVAQYSNGQLGIQYDRYDHTTNSDGNDVVSPKIAYSIEYTVAQNQTLGVNLEANQCFNQDIYQDMDDMINAVSKSQSAHDKYDKIKAMMNEDQYANDTDQEKLKDWLALAEKEMNYYDDNLSKLYSSTLGKVDTYLSKITLSITDLGCRVDQLKLTEKRMSDQQESVEELKSNNDNKDLSEIIMDYTSSYTAYQSSLVAAGKLGEQTLLNYI